MNIQNLTDNELNRAIIWLNHKDEVECDDGFNVFIYTCYGSDVCDYLTDWSLTGPLMVNNRIKLEIDNYPTEGYVSAWYGGADAYCATTLLDSPLRAICECVLMVRMGM